jgi:hypothetical protein
MHSQKDQCLGVSKTQASEVSFKHSGKITVKNVGEATLNSKEYPS